MVTKEQKEILLLKKEILELKAKQQQETFKRSRTQRKRAPVPSDEIDYGWCPPTGDEPTISATFENKRVVIEYSNKKRVR